MSALRAAVARWTSGQFNDGQAPKGITIKPLDIESGHAASRRHGSVHIVADAARISDGSDERVVASWLCGGSSVDAVEVPHEPEAVCSSCTLAAALPQRPCVYFAWGDDDELLYIGSTRQAMTRIRAHINGTPWWSEVRRLSFTEYAAEDEARRAESIAIWETPSKYNREGTKAAAKRKSRDLLAGISVETAVAGEQERAS